MNYEPNTREWQPGDLVLHDADAKRPEMLMRVKRYTRDGRVVTRYVHPNFLPGMRKEYTNPARCLHDPARFGVKEVTT